MAPKKVPAIQKAAPSPSARRPEKGTSSTLDYCTVGIFTRV